jgi:hypothetical protein
MTDDRDTSPFDRPQVGGGYPLDADEERAVRDDLDRIRPARAPEPVPAQEEQR